MPDPQPAWAQQYDFEMHPAWARKFEPPAVTGGESQGAMRTLITIARQTGDRKYLEPIPRALAYLRKSALTEGRLARFYELNTNRPLYFTKDYTLTYSDRDMPTHYGFKVGASLDRVEREYRKALELKPGETDPAPEPSRPKLSRSLENRARKTVTSLDDKGRWVEDGRLKYFDEDDPTRRIINCRTFIRNVEILSDYLTSTR